MRVILLKNILHKNILFITYKHFWEQWETSVGFIKFTSESIYVSWHNINMIPLQLLCIEGTNTLFTVVSMPAICTLAYVGAVGIVTCSIVLTRIKNNTFIEICEKCQKL